MHRVLQNRSPEPVEGRFKVRAMLIGVLRQAQHYGWQINVDNNSPHDRALNRRYILSQ